MSYIDDCKWRTNAKIHRRVLPKIFSLNRSLMGHKMRIFNNTELFNIREFQVRGWGSESGNCLKELSSSSTCHQWLKYNPSSFKFHLKVGISSIYFVDKKIFAFNLDTSLTHFNIDFRHHKESSSIYIF